MMWQDIVIPVANLIFIYSLANQIYYGFKKKKGLITLPTSGLTALGLYTMAITFFTLKLVCSGIVTAISGSLWIILFIQRIKYKKA